MQHLTTFLNIFRAYDGFGDYRYALDNIGDECGAFVGVVCRITHQEVGLETDEVDLMRCDIFLKLRSIMFASKAVGVIAIG